MNVLIKQNELKANKIIQKEIVNEIQNTFNKVFNHLNDYSIDLNDLDFSGAFNMTNMFLECRHLSSIPDTFNNVTIIGNEEAINRLKRGQ